MENVKKWKMENEKWKMENAKTDSYIFHFPLSIIKAV